MTPPPGLVHLLRNTPVRELIRALERDGFSFRRGRGSGEVYRHLYGRRVVVHYHASSETLPPGTLRSVLSGARWTQEDASRLGLI